MAEEKPVNAIPADLALRLCEEIRKENRGKWYKWTAWWCWGCSTFTKGDPAKMCYRTHPQCRGCGQVNARYDQQTVTG